MLNKLFQTFLRLNERFRSDCAISVCLQRIHLRLRTSACALVTSLGYMIISFFLGFFLPLEPIDDWFAVTGLPIPITVIHLFILFAAAPGLLFFGFFLNVYLVGAQSIFTTYNISIGILYTKVHHFLSPFFSIS